MFKNNFNKKNLIENLKEQTGLSSNYSKKLVHDLIEIIKQNIKSGELNLKNLGTFKSIKKKERVGRNPKTKEQFTIASRKSISFKPSKEISEKLKNFLWKN